MKILFANDNLIGGGAEKLMNDLLPLINQEHRCDLLILTWEGEKYRDSLKKSGVKVRAVPESIKTHLGKIKYVRAFIEHGNYDIVHANEFPMLYYCAIAGKLAKNKPLMIVTEHDTSNRRRNYRFARQLERFIYSKYKKIVSISPETQESIVKWLRPLDSRKFVTVYNGIPVRKFQNEIKYGRGDVFPKITDDDILLCVVASLTYKKNHSFMFDVMDKLPDRYKLILCGEGELYDELNADVKRRGLSDRVVFLGFRSDVASIMKTADIIVIPSKWEGFGLISVEAMACERPIVCTDSPGMGAIIGDAGLKVRVDDCKGFVQAIERLEDETLRSRLIDNCKSQCMKFDISKMKEGYLKVYEDALNGGG